MPIIDALEWMLLINEKEAEDYNNKRQDQLIDFQSMRLAASGMMGGSDELEGAIKDHEHRLSQFAGKRGEAQEKARKQEYQLDLDLMERLKREQQGRR